MKRIRISCLLSNGFYLTTMGLRRDAWVELKFSLVGVESGLQVRKLAQMTSQVPDVEKVHKLEIYVHILVSKLKAFEYFENSRGLGYWKS